jgi:anti-anti-sigma factor
MMPCIAQGSFRIQARIEDSFVATIPGSQRWLTIENRAAEDGTPTLVCKGRINLESANMLRAEVKNLSSTHRTVLADLSEVDAVDSAGLGSVLGTYVSAKNDGCELVLVNVHPRVKDLLNITKLTTILAVK